MWHKKDCGKRFSFYCSHIEMVLVKENKTWEEAMEHCRQHQRELVSMKSESALNETLRISRAAQTTRVWTGLRYLADTWLWVGGGTMNYQAWGKEGMPHCPAVLCRCGALSLEGGRWESWDCAEKLNFVCN
ncbi:snaclec agglucetin subunit beta-2-like [Tautogolabrus adspersus]